ncbi:hypothetical protein L3Q82_008432 [Scortum barcoo]|uniref:Uncharacterized protein n=1 Tax=Scortum barcoo TaxID=214431 RepID=A0ACB8XBV0_9TELE|nr:hypothetical protein L3Q82_008432 [Scortum barcoo]
MGDHTLQPPWEGLCQGTGEENSADRPSRGPDPRIQEEQCGFRPGRGTVDQLFTCPWQGARRGMGVCPTSPHVFCRYGEVCPEALCGDTPRTWGCCPLSPVLFIIFMDRISRRSIMGEGVRFGDLRIPSLLFADDVVLLASSSSDLQLSLGRFAAECEAAGMRISTSKSEAMVLSRERVDCPLRVGEEFLAQVEEFGWRKLSVTPDVLRATYLRVLFTSEGKMEQEMDRGTGAASAVLRTLMLSIVVKRELSQKAKLSIYWSIYVPRPSPMVMSSE